MAGKQNCWEFTACGREPGGPNVGELGVCPAATDTSSDGINGGDNGGRLCWAIAGTFCGGIAQGTGAAKKLTCLHCDFFERVMHEEGRSLSMPTHVVHAGSRRLTTAALVLAIIWALYAGFSFAIGSEVAGHLLPIVVGIAVASSIALAVYLRTGRPTQRAIAVVFAYEALQVLAFSVLEFSSADSGVIANQVSWTCVLILFFPLLVAASPRATLVGSLIAASMSPVGYAVALAFGAPAASDLWIGLSRLLPQFACAALAYVPARVLHRLSTDVKRARRLGSYELVACIGKGGMGEVWRARHRMLVRPAAVKLIRTANGDLERLRQRFEREAQATATLESPHTVQLYDFGVSDDGAFYYVMELLRGIDMETLVLRFGPQPPERVLYLLRQTCDSLDDAHRIGLVHRDVKPSNIYLALKGRRFDYIKVLDFGLVKLRRDSVVPTATAEGTLLGTPSYMAPEMITGVDGVDGRADVYALGCVGYWLLTGKLVFECPNLVKMAVAHVSTEPVRPSQRTELVVPEPLEKIVMACLAKDPSERPSALGLARMLDACQLDTTWTDDRAADWWNTHLPDVVSGAHAPAPASGQMTGFLRPV